MTEHETGHKALIQCQSPGLANFLMHFSAFLASSARG